MSTTLIQSAYLIAAILFILGLRNLSSPKTAALGNAMSAAGMLIAIVATLLYQQVVSYPIVLAAGTAWHWFRTRWVKIGGLWTRCSACSSLMSRMRRPIGGLACGNFVREAIANFQSIVDIDDAVTRERGFDFSQDYRLLNELGQTLFERAKQQRSPEVRELRRALLEEAISWFDVTLELDPENVTAHYNLALLHGQLGHMTRALEHRDLHERYKRDDNARDRAVTAARLRYPAADHAANSIVIYDLQRKEAFGLASAEEDRERSARRDR